MDERNLHSLTYFSTCIVRKRPMTMHVISRGSLCESIDRRFGLPPIVHSAKNIIMKRDPCVILATHLVIPVEPTDSSNSSQATVLSPIMRFFTSILAIPILLSSTLAAPGLYEDNQVVLDHEHWDQATGPNSTKVNVTLYVMSRCRDAVSVYCLYA
jgi:hypothetical protein